MKKFFLEGMCPLWRLWSGSQSAVSYIALRSRSILRDSSDIFIVLKERTRQSSVVGFSKGSMFKRLMEPYVGFWWLSGYISKGCVGYTTQMRVIWRVLWTQ